MSKQYCRYCGMLSEGDCYYCNYKGVMSEDQIKRANTCKYYGYTDVGDIITGKQYKPRAPYRKHEKAAEKYEQIEMEFENETC